MRGLKLLNFILVGSEKACNRLCLKDIPSINFNNLTTFIMAINLQKGGRIDLSKESTASVFRIGLGWDAAQPGKEFDLDAMAILLGADGKAVSDDAMALGNTGSWQSIGEIERVLPNLI